MRVRARGFTLIELLVAVALSTILIGVLAVTFSYVTRAQDQSELPEIQSIIHANGTKVIQPSGWTANTNVGSAYSTGYGDGQSIRFGLHSQADLNRATGIVGDQYATGKFREASYSQGASYSYATSETGAPGLLRPRLFGRLCDAGRSTGRKDRNPRRPVLHRQRLGALPDRQHDGLAGG